MLWSTIFHKTPIRGPMSCMPFYQIRRGVDQWIFLFGFNTTRHEKEEEVSRNGQVVPQKDTFWYLGSMLQKDGDIYEDMNHRIKVGWMKWRQASRIFCDKRVPKRLKGKFYRTVIQPAMFCDVECWPTKRRHVQQLGVTEIHMLRWMCCHTRKDRHY
jgi:hypothetical protein